MVFTSKTIKATSNIILIMVNIREYILFPKPSNIFAEIMETGVKTIRTVPPIAIQNISFSIPVMENMLNAYSRKKINAIITTSVVKIDIFITYLNIFSNSSNFSAPNK